MPSATPPPHSSPDPERPTAEPPQAEPAGADAGAPRKPNPRVQAALCYAFPVVPAVVMLLRERHNGFVRFHAARSLVLFGGIVLVQVLVFALVVILGNAVGTAEIAVVLGLLVLVAYLALAICGLILWLRLLAEAMAGKGRVYPYLDFCAINLELLITHVQRRLFR
jgi:uncharacterized membrane protein